MSIMESLPTDAQELVSTERQRHLSVVAAGVAVRVELEDFEDFNDLSGEQQVPFGD